MRVVGKQISKQTGKQTVKRAIAAVLNVTLRVTFVAIGSTCLSQATYAAATLAAAARADDLAQLQRLIKSGADINVPEPDGTTGLLWAVYNGSPQLVQLLLKAGADPNIANSLDISPLLQASRAGHADMIKALLANGAKLDATHGNTEPALMAAARAGSVDSVKVLLAAGADPNGSEPLEQQTALMWAVTEGHLDIARALLKAGANPNLQARVSTLTKRKNADFPSGGFAALHWAARNGDEAMISLLIENGANLNARNGDNSTPMMLAIVNDRFDTAAKLLKRGADANDGSLYFITEMRDATTDWRARDGTVFRADHPNQLSALDFTRLLLEAGADPNQPFIGQMHNASMCCDTKANATAFSRAAIAADVDALILMLAHGANTEWLPAKTPTSDGADDNNNSNNKTALMLAINGGKGVGIAGGPNDLREGLPKFREAANRDTLAAVAVLLEAGAAVNARDANAETALHIAAKALHPGIVRALVAKGAALDAQDKEGLTPLQVVEKMETPKPRPGFFFLPPPAQPAEIIALLQELSGEKAQ
jgi:ankyrin repeat protein